MKKNIFKKYALLTILGGLFLILFADNVYAATFDVCNSSGIVKTFQMGGYALFLVKIIIPILLMVIAFMDFGKALLASDEGALKNAINIVVKRAIAGIVVFFIPTIISTVIGLIDAANELSDFDCLSKCIKSPTTCSIPKDGGVFDNSK